MIAAVGSASPNLTPRAVVGPTEYRVTQYGPEWMEHVLNGGSVREGNILLNVRYPI